MVDCSTLELINTLGHTFSRTLIPKDSGVVVDCGANEGEFARYCAEHLGAHVYSYEADPLIAAHLPKISGVLFQNKAVTGQPGTTVVRRADGLCSSTRFHLESKQDGAAVEGITLPQIIEKHGLGTVDLLKLDIEGTELDVLENTPAEYLRRCRQISCEFHDFLCPTDRPRIEAVCESLKSDFVIVCMSVFTFGDVLMVRKDSALNSTKVHRQMILHKYRAGMRRVLGRLRPLSQR